MHMTKSQKYEAKLQYTDTKDYMLYAYDSIYTKLKNRQNYLWCLRAQQWLFARRLELAGTTLKGTFWNDESVLHLDWSIGYKCICHNHQTLHFQSMHFSDLNVTSIKKKLNTLFYYPLYHLENINVKSKLWG